MRKVARVPRAARKYVIAFREPTTLDLANSPNSNGLDAQKGNFWQIRSLDG
jgi:hypothetical protein